MKRTLPLTPDDLTEAQTAISTLIDADQALRDLKDRCHAKEDELRVGRIRVAISRVGEARTIVEHCFR